MARVFTSARRSIQIDIRMALLLPIVMLTQADDPVSEETLVAQHERDRLEFDTYALLGRDCPRRLRHRLDELLCGGQADENDETRTWLIRWSERKPEASAILLGG
jgi:hypothetical protein